MGVCERLVLFEYRYGQRRSAQQRKSAARGGREHRRFYLEGQEQPVPRVRFIATLVYGEGYEVDVLRWFRDGVLRPSMLGRFLILRYYRAVPAVCRALACHPWLMGTMRALLRPVIWGVAWLEKWRSGDG